MGSLLLGFRTATHASKAAGVGGGVLVALPLGFPGVLSRLLDDPWYSDDGLVW
jgi:hypothetical protein